ncbi:MAG: gamma-glutamylcyclotransferase family protein [Gammaproteobacteria bacterium]
MVRRNYTYLKFLLFKLFQMGALNNTDFIFVYGTLRSLGKNPMSRVLAGNARFMGEAFFPGRLYRVKHYPGAVPSDDPEEIVQGEVFFLPNKRKLLSILDRYEACSPNFPKPTEFVRTIQAVYLENGRCVSAWIYIYNHSTAGLELIASGNFLTDSGNNGTNRPRPFYRNRNALLPFLKKIHPKI